MSVCLSVCLFVHMEELGSHWMSFHEIWFSVLLKNVSIQFKFHYNLTIITGTLHEDRYTFVIISCWILLRMRDVSDESCRENQNIFLCTETFFPDNCVVCELIWKNVVEPGEAIIWHMCFACWITKATNTHSEYVIFTAFPQQQWFVNAPQCYVYV